MRPEIDNCNLHSLPGNRGTVAGIMDRKWSKETECVRLR